MNNKHIIFWGLLILFPVVVLGQSNKDSLKLSPKSGMIIGGLCYQVISPNQTSVFMMVGGLDKIKAYFKLQSNFGVDDPQLECKDNGIINGTERWFTKNTERVRLSITVGKLFPLSDNMTIFAGGGYGSRMFIWHTLDNKSVKNTDHSVVGLAAEGGAIFKLDKVYVLGGITSVNFFYMETFFGLGMMF